MCIHISASSPYVKRRNQSTDPILTQVKNMEYHHPFLADCLTLSIMTLGDVFSWGSKIIQFYPYIIIRNNLKLS